MQLLGMSCDEGVIDLTDGIPPYKRQRLDLDASRLAEAGSSAGLTRSSGARNGPHWAYQEQQQPPREVNVKKDARNRPLPSPEFNEKLFELGAVRLPCRAVQNDQAKTTSIKSLSQRVSPFGFQKQQDGKPDEYGDSLFIGNLFERSFRCWTANAAEYEPRHIELDPCPLPADVKEPTQQRLQAVTVVHCDGSRAPLKYGIALGWNATYGQLKEGIKEQCQIPGGQQVTLALLYRNLYTSFVGGNDAHLAAHVPEGTSAKVCCSALLGNNTFPLHDGSDSDSSDDSPYHHYGLPHSDDSSDGEVIVPRAPAQERLVAYIMSKPKNPNKTKNVIVYTNSSALPLLLPIKSKWTKGGPEADKHVRAAISKALAPAALPGLAKGSSFALSLSDRAGFNEATPFSVRSPLPGYDDCTFLCAVWDQETLAKEYNMKIMAEPVVHESADKDLLAESSTGFLLLRQFNKAMAEAKEMPWHVVHELQRASEAVPCAPSGQRWPLIHLSMTLEAASDKPEEAKGNLVFKVWCWKNDYPAVPGQQRLMQNLDDWAAVKNMSYECQAQNFRLKNFMAFLCKGLPRFDQMQAELEKWSKLDVQKQRTLPGMMALLQADERPEADQPEGLSVSLRPYQRQSLKFMLDIEQTEGGFRDQLFCQVSNSQGDTFWYSPVLGRCSSHVDPMPQGGILGEEMGLGKTVEVAALVLSHPAAPLQSTCETTRDGLIASRATLVVCPVSLMGQWAEELADKAKGRLKVLLHHGPKRSKDPKDLAAYDIVLVTYQTLGLDFSRGSKETSGDGKNRFPPCGSIQWHRIVLDEAHTVKNPGAQLTKACMALASNKRWCVTGTPVGSDIADLKGQFNFLQLHPFTNKNFFSIYVKPAYSGSTWARPPASILLCILSQCMIRHTKLQVLGGEEVLQLPGKTENLVPVSFSQEEQELYMHVFERARTNSLTKTWPWSVPSFMLNITVLPELPNAVGTVSMAVNADAVCTEEACCICFESPIREPTRTKCNHWFCWECIGTLLQGRTGAAASLVCPLCRAKVQGQELVKGVNEDAQTLEEEDSFAASLERKASTSESKLMALLEELRVMRENDPTAKALVFSQFVSTIEWLKVKLAEQGFSYRTISGSMSLQQRSKAIEAFQKDPPTTVFLLSMRSGSVGINLTSANYVFILEPALNPALEEQAVGRAWRMGQQREVTVKKFFVKGSVEERIMQMVQQRKEGSKSQEPSTSGGLTWADLGQVRGSNRNQVKAQDIVGSMKADKQNLRMEELDLLFQTPSFSATA
ncbi:hypothetical protein WJX77_009137 [Trebouxia sp. C0004]